MKYEQINSDNCDGCEHGRCKRQLVRIDLTCWLVELSDWRENVEKQRPLTDSIHDEWLSHTRYSIDSIRAIDTIKQLPIAKISYTFIEQIELNSKNFHIEFAQINIFRVTEPWTNLFFRLQCFLYMYAQSREKMMKGVRRGCVRLRDASIGIDDQDALSFTITVDHKTFHFQVWLKQASHVNM